MSQLFLSGGQSIVTAVSASVLPMNSRDCFPLELSGLISCYPDDSQGSSPTPQFKSINYSALSLLYDLTLTSIHAYWKNHSLTIQTFVGKVISLLFNTQPSFVIAFLPRSKNFIISWLWSSSAVILEPKKIKSVMVSIVSPSICHKVLGPDVIILVFCFVLFFVFCCGVLSKLFHSLLSPSSRGFLVPLSFLP